MESFTFQHDVKTYCVTATSFPEGIQAAHEQLHALLPQNDRRNYYGVSWQAENGSIIYKAAADIMETDGPELANLETFTIKNGPYNSFFIANYAENLDGIKRAFDLLLEQHEVDPNGYCLEWYMDRDVKCMVPLGKEYKPFTGLNKE